MKRTLSILTIVLASTLPGIAQAELSFVGPEFLVNSYTGREQRTESARSVSRGADGSFVAVWSGDHNGGGDPDAMGTDIFGRRFDADGAPVGTEFQVNTYLTGDQQNVAVSVGGGGKFVIVWETDAGIGSCDLDSECGEMQVCGIDGRCHGGGQDGDGLGVFGRLYDGAGNAVTGEIQINSYTTDAQSDQVVAMDDDGNFVVAWEAEFDENDVFARFFDSTGTAPANEFRVNTFTASAQRDPVIAYNGPTGFVLAWEAAGSRDGDAKGVFAQRLDAAGSPIGTEFQVNTYFTGEQVNPSIAASGSGNGAFVIAWDSSASHPSCDTDLDCDEDTQFCNLDGKCAGGDQDGGGKGVYGQRFDVTGARVGSEFQINTYTEGNQEQHALAMDRDGAFFAVWRRRESNDSMGIRGRAYDTSGNPAGDEFTVNTETNDRQSAPSVATDRLGNHVAVWESDGQDGSKEGVFAQRFRINLAQSEFCGDPVGPAGSPAGEPREYLVNTSDALVVMQVAVGIAGCEPCVCDVDSSGAVRVTDALIVLQKAVGADVELTCPTCD